MTTGGNDRQQRDGVISTEERTEFKRRASKIGERLDEIKSHRSPPAVDGRRGRGLAQAMRLSTELIGGIVVGSAIGWLLDRWLGTKPWLFIVFFFLGTAAGFLNLVRASQREQTPPAPSVPDDDDK